MSERTSSSAAQAIERTSEATVDSLIETMANRRLGDVVRASEFMREDGTTDNRISVSLPHGCKTAADYLVCRMFTDAIFNEDIRTIQLIINRIDGGLPSDEDMDTYSTQFSDCFNEIMQMTSDRQTQLLPDDTVMMALCKALYALSVQDIYWDEEKQRKRRPSTDKKQERDNALRMVLERTGGRKTKVKQQQQQEQIDEADWVKNLKLLNP